jgi:alkanesulfonate monooxygenase
LSETARAEGLSIRQLYQRIAGGRGHYQIVGSPAEVADMMEEWLSTGGADGFNVLPPFFPNSLDEFVGLVVPELQRRGLYRTAYQGRTLRENLELPRPTRPHLRDAAKAAE